jgi:hypothetical protein
LPARPAGGRGKSSRPSREAFLKDLSRKGKNRDRKGNISWQIRFVDNMLMKRKPN